MEIVNKVKELNLARGEYIVIGSSILSLYGLRKNRDIDIIVSDSVMKRKMANPKWKAHTLSCGTKTLKNDIFEIGPSAISVGGYKTSLSKLLKNANIFAGVPFMSFEDLLNFKKSLGREKDMRDIVLLQNFLSGVK